MGPNETETMTEANIRVHNEMLEPADLGASKPIPQPKPRYTVEHARVVACGHKLEAGHFPRNSNCPDCWFALFETTPEGVASVHALLLNGGTRAIVATHGSKFAKHFGKYLQQKLLTLHQQAKVEAPSAEIEVLDISAEKVV